MRIREPGLACCRSYRVLACPGPERPYEVFDAPAGILFKEDLQKTRTTGARDPAAMYDRGYAGSVHRYGVRGRKMKREGPLQF